MEVREKKALVVGLVENDVLVNFIGYQVGRCIPNNIGKPLEIRCGKNRTGWVVREI